MTAPQHRSVGKVEVVQLSGRLDAAAAPAVRKLLRSLVEGGRSLLVADFAAVSFVDSSGLSVLVTALKAARAAGGDVAVSSPNDNVRALLELTRLHRVFLVFPDADGAVEALAGE